MIKSKNNKALCVLNFSGRYGGAEKRYVTLFNRLVENHLDYYLIINTKLYRLFLSSSVIKPHERIILFNDGGDGIPVNKKGTFGINCKHKTKENSVLRLFLGHWKYFLKTAFLWLRLSFFFICRVRQYQIKRLYTVWQGGIWTWMWCRFLKIRLVYSVNASGNLMLDKNIYRIFDSQYHVLQNADMLDFLSPSLVQDYTKALGLKKIRGKQVVTPNSFIDYTNYYPEEPKKEWVIFSGRLESVKNPMLFLEAVNKLSKSYQNPYVKFLVMGTGSLLGRMQKYIHEHNLENVEFTGLYSCPWEIIRKSSVFASLQAEENYPSQSLIEAMACENGIVATDVGNTRLLVTEEEGILVEPNPEPVAQAFLELLSNTELREKLGRNARQKVMKTQIIERFVEWFDAMMSEEAD
jgi:glycosyltransferase involved in cell wall biosynthesis